MSGETTALMQRLERHYIKPDGYAGGILIPECGVNGAWGAGSRCDALYVGFTSTSGRLLVGHEVKVSRSDWLRELEKSGKADAWADQCHAWYVVAPNTSIVRPEELPEGWGLLTIGSRTRTRLEVTVKAKVHADRTPSWDAVRSIMARLDTLQREAANQVHIDANTKAEKRIQAEVERRVQNTPDKRLADGLRAMLDRVQDALGVQLHDHRNGAASPGWDDDQRTYVTPERLAEALRLLDLRYALKSGGRRGGIDRAIEVITEAHGQLTSFASELDDFFTPDDAGVGAA